MRLFARLTVFYGRTEVERREDRVRSRVLDELSALWISDGNNLIAIRDSTVVWVHLLETPATVAF